MQLFLFLVGEFASLLANTLANLRVAFGKGCWEFANLLANTVVSLSSSFWLELYTVVCYYLCYQRVNWIYVSC